MFEEKETLKKLFPYYAIKEQTPAPSYFLNAMLNIIQIAGEIVSKIITNFKQLSFFSFVEKSRLHVEIFKVLNQILDQNTQIQKL